MATLSDDTANINSRTKTGNQAHKPPDKIVIFNIFRMTKQCLKKQTSVFARDVILSYITLANELQLAFFKFVNHLPTASLISTASFFG